MNLKHPIAQGNTAEVYLDGEKLIKLYRAGAAAGIAACEAHKQETAGSRGLRVPRVLRVCAAEGRQAIVMEYVKGQTLGALMARDTARAGAYLALSVDVQAGVHRKSGAGLVRLRERLSRRLRETDRLDPALCARLLKCLAALPDGDRLCHGDFHVYNLLQAPDGVVIIDWLDAAAGHPYADACRTWLLYAATEEALAQRYLALYCDKTGARPAEVMAFLPVIAGARLWESAGGEDADRLLRLIQAHMDR